MCMSRGRAAANGTGALVRARALRERSEHAKKADADALAECPNLWVPREVVEGTMPPLTTAEQAVQQLYLRLVNTQLAPCPDTWRGAEYWCQIYEGGRGLGFHFDKDEHAMVTEQRMSNPIFSSVLYLTGSPADKHRQAPTVLIDQWYSHEQRCMLPEHPAWSSLVFPVRNQYCLFGGKQAHGVLEGMAEAVEQQQQQQQRQQQQQQPKQQQEYRQAPKKQRRVTFLVNWWAQQPENVVRATAEDVAAGTLAAACEALGIATGSSNGRSGGDEAAALATLSLEEAEPTGQQAEQQQQQPQQPRPVEFVHVDAPALQSGNVLPIDELLQQRRVCISGGEGAPAHAVTIAHPGLTLVPLDEEQVDPAHPLQVLAALVPTTDLGSADSNSGSGSSSDEGEGEKREQQ